MLFRSTSAREEDISPLPIKEEGNNETVSSGILDMYNRSKEQYPDAMALIRVGDEYKAYNQDAERLHEVLGVCARKAVSEKDGTPVMTASFRHVDLDTHLRSIIKAGSKVTINHYEKAAAPIVRTWKDTSVQCDFNRSEEHTSELQSH